MRDIKYQVFIKETKEMLPVTSLVQMTDEEGIRVFPLFPLDGQGRARNYLTTEGEIELREFSGLIDKNGVAIFEGDILMLPNPYYETVDVGVGGPGVPVAELPGAEFGTVVFINGAFSVDMEKSTHDVHDGINALCFVFEEEVECEVVGNIYQNPELLTK